MRKNHVTWEKLTGCEHRYTSKILHGRQLFASKYALGFHYGVVTGLEREYAYSLVRWMALKVGKRCRTFGHNGKEGRSNKPIPYYVYDGFERFPVFTEQCGLPSGTYRAVDNYGILKRPYLIDLRMAGLHKIHFDKMKKTKDGKYLIFPITAADCKKYGLRKGSHMNTPAAQKLFERLGREAVRRDRKFIRDEIKRLDALWEGS